MDAEGDDSSVASDAESVANADDEDEASIHSRSVRLGEELDEDDDSSRGVDDDEEGDEGDGVDDDDSDDESESDDGDSEAVSESDKDDIDQEELETMKRIVTEETARLASQMTPQQRQEVVGAPNSFRRFVSAIMNDDGYIYFFCMNELVVMTLSPIIKEQYFRALNFADQYLTDFAVGFGYDGLQEQLATFQGLVTYNDLQEQAVDLGQALHAFQDLSCLHVSGSPTNDDQDVSGVPLACSVLHNCRSCKQIRLTFGTTTFLDHLPSLEAALQYHPTLSELGVWEFDIAALEMICRVLPTLPNLQSFRMGDANFSFAAGQNVLPLLGQALMGCTLDDEFLFDSGVREELWDPELVALFLNSYLLLMVPTLFLCVDAWTTSLEQALARYIRENSALRQLTVVVKSPYLGPMVAPAPIIEAVSTGTRSLEALRLVLFHPFTGEGEFPQPTETNWHEPLEETLVANRFRHEYADAFEMLEGASHEDMQRQLPASLATEELDHSAIFQFFRDDDWGVRNHLINCLFGDPDANN